MNKRIKEELQEKHIRKLKRGWDKSPDLTSFFSIVKLDAAVEWDNNGLRIASFSPILFSSVNSDSDRRYSVQ